MYVTFMFELGLSGAGLLFPVTSRSRNRISNTFAFVCTMYVIKSLPKNFLDKSSKRFSHLKPKS